MIGHDLNYWSRPPLRSLTKKVVATSIFLQGLRLAQLHVATSNPHVVTLNPVSCRDLNNTSQPQVESFIQELVATSNFLVETSFFASSTDQRRDLGLASRPQLSSIGVATSMWCRDLRFYQEYFCSLTHYFLVATCITGCLGTSGRSLNFQS